MKKTSIPAKCINTRSDSPIPLFENKSRITFENPTGRQIQVVTVDNCAIKRGIRCDYLLLDPGGNTAEHYIELKGRHGVRHAIEQIIATIKRISTDSQRLRKNCWIICTQYPKDDTSVQRGKQKLRKNHNAKLEVHTFSYTVILS